jgi:hypothetical protein
MDTLWASLIGLFVIAIGVVLAFNLLQGRQTRLRDAWRETLAAASKPVASRPPPRSEPTVGADAVAGAAVSGERVEPTLAPTASGDDPLREARAAGTQGQGGDDARDLAAIGAAPAPASAPVSAAGPILDPRLDCIVDFGLAAPVAPERLLSAASTLRRAGSKPIAVEADDGSGRWSAPNASFGAVRRLRAGVLLANRHGPLNAMEFSEFAASMQSLGRSIGAGGAVLPDMGPVLEHARQLDEACARMDAVIGLNVETPTALSPAELAALGAGLGLQERGNNRFAALGDDGEVLFSLALGERAEQLTLLLDLPRAPEHAEPWRRMVEIATVCAERTGGRIVDDASRPMTESAAAEVGRQLAMRYRTLREAGLDAGSQAALRVFN